MKEKKILIIGGCGYIGSRLTQFLVKNGYLVHTTDLEWYGKFIEVKNENIDYKLLTKEKIEFYDVIILLAGHSSVPMSIGGDGSTFKNNVFNFIDLIEKLKKNQIFIYASSSSVYNNFNDTALDETYSGYRPTNDYDLSKLTIDYYIAQRTNINYYGLRLGTVNGFSPNFRTDIMINGMWKSYKEKAKIEIFNKEINRPILSIVDLCSGILSIINDGIPEKRGIYNLHSFNATVKEIGIEVASAFQCDIEDKGLSGKPYNFKMDYKKMKENFDFIPQSHIKEICYDILLNENFIHQTNRNTIIKYEN